MEKQNLYIFNFSFFVLKILIITLLIGSIIGFAFEKFVIFETKTNGAYKVNRILHEDFQNEIPIFGSSRAGANIIPSKLGENYFNYAIAGGNANIWLFFLEQELKKNKYTPILINYDLGGLRNGNGDIGNYIPNWDATKDIITYDKKLYYNVPFFKYFGHYEHYLRKFLNERLELTKIIDNGGIFELNTLTNDSFEDIVLKRKNTPHIFKMKQNLLEKMNDLISSTNRLIIFIVPPYHESFFFNDTNMYEDNNFLSFLNQKKNVEVIDLRHAIVKDEYFFDTSHLTYNGAKKITEKLKVILQKINSTDD
tara:strand:+ start:2291 stop:3217 length:927 start_codon:yes stop_codon:yes gene_type:complete